MEHPGTLLPPAPKRGFAARVFGYDVFVSFALGPPPRGSHSYASDLARRLRELDFTVFFSEDEAPVGSQLDRTLQKALHRSQTLVVIANRGTLADPRWVRTEVEAFRRRNPQRPIVPISIGGALQDPKVVADADEWLRFRDRIWVDESEQAGASGIASDEVVSRLATAPVASRANTRWRAVIGSSIALLVGLAGVAVWWALAAQAAEARARAELKSALSLRLLAESQAMFTGARQGGDERALLQLVAAERLAPSVVVENELLQTLLRLRGLRRFIGPVPELGTVAISSDGDQLATGGDDGYLRRWSASDGAPIGEPVRGHEAAIRRVIYSADGHRMASAGTDGTLQLWDAATGRPGGAALIGHFNRVNAILFSPDGRRLASGGGGNPSADAIDRHAGRQSGPRDYSVRLWDAETGKAIGSPLEGHGGAVGALAFSSDGALVASGSADRSVRLWRVGGPPGPSLVGLDDEPVSLALSGDGRLVAFGTAGGALYLWDAGQQPPRAVLLGRKDRAIVEVGFAADAHSIDARLDNGASLHWDGSELESVGDPVLAIKGTVDAVAAGGRRLASISDGGFVSLLQPVGEASLGFVVPGGRGITSVAFSLDGTVIATTGRDATLRFWNGISGAPVQPSARSAGDGLVGVAWNKDGQRVLTIDPHQRLEQWDAVSHVSLSAPTPAADATISRAAFAPDGRLVAAFDNRMRLSWRDTSTGTLLGEPVEVNQNSRQSLAFSPDGQRLITVGGKPSRWWDVASRRPGGEALGGESAMSVTFSPDGRRVAAGNIGGITVQNVVGDNAAGPIFDPAGSGAVMMSVGFSSDGSRIVAGSNLGALHVWDAASGQHMVSALDGHHGIVRDLVFARDGQQFATVGEDGTLRLWPAPRAWADRLCGKLVRNMSQLQWREWVSSEIPYTCQCPELPLTPDVAGAAPAGRCASGEAAAGR